MMTNKTILIVDDTIINLDILVVLLKEYDVLVAVNGLEALTIASENKPDLILLDIMMPDMDGYEVCTKLKENQNTKDIPIIFITVKTDEDSIEKAFDIGGVDYVTKPFRSKELLARVTTQLKIAEQSYFKDKLIQEQAKMASMGEMIGNIAHQWRQPLNAISLTASALQLKLKIEEDISKEYFDKELGLIDEYTQHLSNTINTFRDFIKAKKVYKELILQDEISQALNISVITLKNKFIKLKDNIDYENGIKTIMTTGELGQVIINIMNNAKDILVEKNIENPFVKIELKKLRDKVIITIEDNGGGIPADILPKIFELYFTTKHQSHGTGLGLHMSYAIITNSLKGKLWAENIENGAKFFIELPLN